MTTLLSAKEWLERLDNVILLLIHSCFPHAVKQDGNSDNTHWPMCDRHHPVSEMQTYTHLQYGVDCYTKHVCV